MDQNFLIRLNYKFHRVRTVFLSKRKDNYNLTTNFHKVCVEMSVNKLNSEGYSVDFGVIKNAIKSLTQDIEGKVIILKNDHKLELDQNINIIKVSCFNGQVFEFNEEKLIFVNGTHLKEGFDSALAARVYASMKSITNQDEVLWTKISITDLIKDKTSDYHFGLKQV